jgi:hypothetical protein
VTVLEFAPPEPEEQQREPPQGEGTEEEEDLPECPDHRPCTYIEGKPQSIIRLPLFLLSCPAVNYYGYVLLH